MNPPRDTARTTMPTVLPVYIPNISTEALLSLLARELGDDADKVGFERVPTRLVFRGPGLHLIVPDDPPDLRTRVIQHLIHAAYLLGATQFSFDQSEMPVRPRPTDTPPEEIERLLIALNRCHIRQINLI